MATIILSAVGSAIGGPFGGAIGAAIGQQIDQQIFAPKAKEGPRLSDLKIQTSSYVAPVPKLFGTTRVAGIMIWATDLREERRKVSNGKGAAKTTVFSYSASFAIALSMRPIIRVGRIWADGKLLRGAAGDFKTITQFRLHLGTEDQSTDPAIAAAEGSGNAPAYRGLAYAVFENFELGDYGNRIPSLSFEVIADEGDVAVGSIITSLAPKGITANCPTMVGGFAALGASVASVCQTLRATIPFYLRDDGQSLHAAEAEAVPFVIPDDALGATDKADVPKIAIDQQSAGQLPARLLLSHYEPSRDYQVSAQQAQLLVQSRRSERIEFPATLTAIAARKLAENNLTRRWTARKQARVQLPWRYAAISPGVSVTLPDDPDLWHVQTCALERMSVSLGLVRVRQASTLPLPAGAGRGVQEQDLLHGPTRIAVLDLPPLTDDVRTQPLVVVAAAGTSAGWRRATLLQSMDDGVNWQDIGATAAPALMGATVTLLALGSANIIDQANSFDVEMLNDGMFLSPSDDDGLATGRNLAMIGSELIQFGSVISLGGRRYRLSGLRRGLRGTAVQAHSTGTGFVVIESDALLTLDVPAGVASVRVIAQGVGDGLNGVEAIIALPHRAVTPLAPVHLRALPDGNGGFALSWVRRSRAGWRWVDMVDAPLAEETERYQISIAPNVGATRTVETSPASFAYSAADKSADVLAGASSVQISVVQIGTNASSPPSILTLPIL